MRFIFSIGIILIIICMCFLPLFSGYVLSQHEILLDGNILYVGGTGPGNYTKIQDAIDDAYDGDMVFVYDESSPYVENVIVNKSIDLIGENRNTTIIEGRDDSCILIESENVIIRGFYLIGEEWGIDSQGFLNEISYSNIYSRLGIRIISTNNDVLNNLFDDGEVAIAVGGDGSNHISGNIIKSHIEGGIYLEDSDENIISGNTFMNYNTADFFTGDMWMSGSDNNIISNNTFIAVIDENEYGIYTEFEAYDNIIEHNSFIGYRGCGIRGGDNGIVQYNDFIDCGTGLVWWFDPHIIHNNFINCSLGLSLYRSNNGYIQYNNFIDNDRNAFFSTFSLHNTWDENYWGEPRDSPYVIIGRLGLLFIPWFNVDWHPAQEPYAI